LYSFTARKLRNLRSRLSESGFGVKQHCCEYFIIKNNRFVGVLSLFPSWNQALFYITISEDEESVKEILRITEEVFPELNMELRNKKGERESKPAGSRWFV